MVFYSFKKAYLWRTGRVFSASNVQYDSQLLTCFEQKALPHTASTHQGVYMGGEGGGVNVK